MSGKFFIDTNVLIYIVDNDIDGKKEKAKHLLQSALNEGSGIISYQVVQEFLSVLTKKFVRTITPQEAQHWLSTILLPICEFYPTAVSFQEALALKDSVGCSFYDALILQAAISQECSVLYSEDFQHGRVIQGVKIQNPFL